jgi:hypothetical protein
MIKTFLKYCLFLLLLVSPYYHLFIVSKTIGSGTSTFQVMGFQTFYRKVSYTLLWAGWRDALAKITINGIANCFNCCAIFVLCTYIIDTYGHGSRVGHPCSGQFVIQGSVLGCECEPESSVRPCVHVRFEYVTHGIDNER